MTREVKLRNYRDLMGEFADARQEETFKVVEKKFDLKKSYTDRDWLTQNR